MARGSVFKQIFKAMGLFGGVQVLTILCAVARTKLVAIWIGPAGIGLFGLYNAAIDMINNISNLGIRSSSVRDISIAAERGSRHDVAQTIAVVRRWSWALGAAAALFTLALAPQLSQWTFGDDGHTWGFVALSVVIMLNALMATEQTVLQGTRRLRQLAQVSLWGVVAGLAVSVPLFYLLREDSIVPSIIAYTAAGAFFAWLFRNRDYSNENVTLTVRQTVEQGAGFVRLGFFMTLSTFLLMLSNYIFAAYLNHAGSLDTVGHYQAGNTIVVRYAGLIFAALGTEYYPRLSAVCHSRLRLRTFVSLQANIILSLLVPVLSLLLLFRTLVVDILYSAEFYTIIPYFSYATVGIVLQGFSWCMALVIVARGKGKVFIVTESISTVLGLALNILFYRWLGLPGIGIAFAVWYLLYVINIGIVYFGIFRLTMHRSAVVMLLYALAAVAAALAATQCGLWWVTALIAAGSAILAATIIARRWRK